MGPSDRGPGRCPGREGRHGRPGRRRSGSRGCGRRKGGTGATGAVGPQGPKGPRAMSVPAGAQGPAGLRATLGPPVRRVRRATRATPGPRVPQGPKGDTGATGARARRPGRALPAPPARPGATGATGAPGATGPSGTTGATVMTTRSGTRRTVTVELHHGQGRRGRWREQGTTSVVASYPLSVDRRRTPPAWTAEFDSGNRQRRVCGLRQLTIRGGRRGPTGRAATAASGTYESAGPCRRSITLTSLLSGGSPMGAHRTAGPPSPSRSPLSGGSWGRAHGLHSGQLGSSPPARREEGRRASSRRA